MIRPGTHGTVVSIAEQRRKLARKGQSLFTPDGKLKPRTPQIVIPVTDEFIESLGGFEETAVYLLRFLPEGTHFVQASNTSGDDFINNQHSFMMEHESFPPPIEGQGYHVGVFKCLREYPDGRIEADYEIVPPLAGDVPHEDRKALMARINAAFASEPPSA